MASKKLKYGIEEKYHDFFRRKFDHKSPDSAQKTPQPSDINLKNVSNGLRNQSEKSCGQISDCFNDK